DQVSFTLSPGARMLRGELSVRARTSSGGELEITLPEDARVLSVRVDGSERPMPSEGEPLKLTLQPGTRSIEVELQQPMGLSAWFSSPVVKLGAEAVNVRVQVNVPS